MALREKLEQLRGESSEWIGGFPPERINEAEWNALIEVALAAIQGNHAVAHKETDEALSRLDKVLDQ